jgi:curved DNA-binding protein CbpA
MPKDYYAILGVTPLAGPDEIRRSYRRLAKQCHPDRHGSDASASLRFQEVKEAYETLTDPVRKDAWLQQRWRLRSMGLRTDRRPATLPADLLKASIALEQEISLNDPHRTDTDALLRRIQALLTADALDLLRQEADPAIREGVCRRLLRCGRHFGPDAAAALVRLLEPVTHTDATLAAEADRFLRRCRRRQAMERVRLPLLLLATLLACLLIARA